MRTIVIDERLARAVARFVANGLEAAIYDGRLEDILVGKLLGFEILEGDTVDVSYNLVACYADIAMLAHAIKAKRGSVDVKVG